MNAKRFYTTPDGRQLLTDWGKDYEQHERTAAHAVRSLARALVIEHGGDLLGGLAYTSTSQFAALWNCNAQARAKAERADGLRAYFHGVAIDENGGAVFNWFLLDESGEEVGEEYTSPKAARL